MTTAQSTADVVVIGSGHNGMVAACYLAREGLTVEVVESDDVWAPVIYIGTLTVTTLAALGMEAVIARSPGLRAPEADARRDLVPGVVTVATLAVALLVALVFPGVGMWSLLLLVLVPVAGRVLARNRGPAAA